MQLPEGDLFHLTGNFREVDPVKRGCREWGRAMARGCA
jgi:hypothetical protein